MAAYNKGAFQVDITVDLDLNTKYFMQGIQDVLTQEKRRAADAIVGDARQLILQYEAIRTGDLYRSIRADFPVKASANSAAYTVAATMPYAKYIHEGTRYMRARPFLKDAVQAYQPIYEARLARGIKDLREGRRPQ